MARKQTRSEPPAFYTAKATFYHRGTTLVLAGHTVAAGHPLLRGRKALFEPFKPTWPLEDETEEDTSSSGSDSSTGDEGSGSSGTTGEGGETGDGAGEQEPAP
jgi:hypothetical protein